MEQHLERHIGDILKERNIEIVGADLATRRGFTQVPNFILTKKDISVGAKLAYAMLLGHFAWSANSSDRMQRIHHFASRDPTRARLSDQRVKHARLNASRADGIHPDALFRVFKGSILGQAIDGMLRRPIGAKPWETDQASNGGKVYNCAASIFEHLRDLVF
jgi:hypothetical protein